MDRDQAKRNVQDATDIIKLIGEQVALRPRGKEYVGLCPFHDDHDPSLHVSPAKQIYKCFVCGAGGDVFSFVMDYHKMAFPEALQFLADRAHIELPRTAAAGGGAESEGPSPRQRLRKANEAAAAIFAALLRHGEHGRTARQYLADRGVSDDMIQAFGIGYAADRWDGLAQTIAARSWAFDDFIAAGLIGARSSGQGYYDRFRHRLMFPIRDAMGRTIAFGGRILPDGTLDDQNEAKYLNSPETAIFNKSSTLFGLDLAKQSIIRERTAVVVEGYTDVIAAHQAGACNVVAALGTALTREHAGALRPLCERVILVFDADEAGQKAADRAMEIFFNQPLDVSIAVLPDGLDPADLLAKNEGVQLWREALARSTDAMAFHFARIRRSYEQAGSLAGRQRVAEEYIRELVNLGLHQASPQRKVPIVRQIAAMMGLDAHRVNRMLSDAAAQRRPVQQRPGPNERRTFSPRHESERLIVGCLLASPALFHEPAPDGRPLCESLLPADIEHSPSRHVYEAIYEWLAEHDQLGPSDLRHLIRDEALLRTAMDLAWQAEQWTDGRTDELTERMSAALRSLHNLRASDDYRMQKTLPQSEQEKDEQTDPAVRRLDLAIRHARDFPSAGRAPRVIG
jgi:DNA primase